MAGKFATRAVVTLRLEHQVADITADVGQAVLVGYSGVGDDGVTVLPLDPSDTPKWTYTGMNPSIPPEAADGLSARIVAAVPGLLTVTVQTKTIGPVSKIIEFKVPSATSFATKGVLTLTLEPPVTPPKV